MEVAQCAKDNWRPLEKGSWSGAASPFETKYIDIRTTESHTDVALSISAEEGAQIQIGAMLYYEHVLAWLCLAFPFLY